jgi:hypothetical protein
MENPSKRAIDELANFLDVGGLPITTDGHFLAYKNVRSNYFDIHSGKFDNSVGKVCEMKRNQVCDDKDLTCSSGLHFCSIAYLPHFSDASGGHTMVVKINPKDVVSFPTDYNNTKGRTCRYEVVGEYTEDWRSKLKNNESGWDADLYDEDGDEYDDDDDRETCEDCADELYSGNYDGNGDKLCGSCYDDKYSDCCGGSCGSCKEEEPQSNPNDCNENHCFCEKTDEHGDIACDMDQTQVGNQGNDHLAGGQADNQYGVKPNGHKFHNLRDALGKFLKKNQ